MQGKELTHRISQHAHMTAITTLWLNVFSRGGCNSPERRGLCHQALNPGCFVTFVPMECRVRDALWLLWLSHGRWYTFWIVPWTMCSGIPEVPVRRWTALSLAKLPGGVTWRCSAPQSPAFQSSQTDWRHESKWTLQRILAPTCLSFPSGRADILEHTQHVPAVSCPSSQFPQNLCAQWINW